MEPLPAAADRAIELFRQRFGQEPSTLIRSPGRVNLIGEHTDYNDGLVLPMAITHALWLAAAPADDRVAMVSADAPGAVEFGIDDIGEPLDGWGVYAQGVAWALAADGRHLTGLRGAVASDIPAGAGLSSSAALELAVARALVSDDDWEPAAVARVAKRAENEWVGVDSGIMDQLSSAAGRRGHALLIDCRTLRVDHVGVPDDVVVVVMDTATRRELAGSAYNDRRRQCAAAAAALGVASLRDVDLHAVERLDDPVLRRRARHVVSENQRTRSAAIAMHACDLTALGSLMAAAHASMRNDFEASSHELDAIVDCAVRTDGCVGARMTGAGFGGCAVALVTADAADAFVESAAAAYRAATGLTPRLYVTEAADGTQAMRRTAGGAERPPRST